VTAVVWIGVGLLSGAGAVARFLLHIAVQRRTASAFPTGTLAVNVLGSLALGILHGAGVTGDAALLMGTAFLGSFTTFSTWMLETQSLAEQGRRDLALSNLLLSLALGLGAVALGWAVAAAF
jgi:CrcB protein